MPADLGPSQFVQICMCVDSDLNVLTSENCVYFQNFKLPSCLKVEGNLVEFAK
jgi:hypothetical protein